MKLLTVWTLWFIFDLACLCTYEMRAKFWPPHHLGHRGIGWSIPTVSLNPLRWWSPSLRSLDTLLLAVAVSGLPRVEARLPVYVCQSWLLSLACLGKLLCWHLHPYQPASGLNQITFASQDNVLFLSSQPLLDLWLDDLTPSRTGGWAWRLLLQLAEVVLIKVLAKHTQLFTPEILQLW